MEKTFLVRINFDINDKMIKYCYENNCIAILVDQPDEKEVWEQHIENQKRTKKKQFIDRWFNLQKCVDEENVIVLVTYKAKSLGKIGKIKKGTKFHEYEKNCEYKIFKLDCVFEFELNKFPIFSSIIPSHVTISPILKRSNVIRHLFQYKDLTNLSIELKNISEKSVELICLEWLRSPLSKNFQLKFQLLLFGRNYPNIDIFGISLKGKRIAAQVTTSNDQNTINSKIKKLNKHNSDIKIIFCNEVKILDNNITEISLNKVWYDLIENGYEEMLRSLVRE